MSILQFHRGQVRRVRDRFDIFGSSASQNTSLSTFDIQSIAVLGDWDSESVVEISVRTSCSRYVQTSSRGRFGGSEIGNEVQRVQRGGLQSGHDT